jgi:hypothetical protein
MFEKSKKIGTEWVLTDDSSYGIVDKSNGRLNQYF